MGFEQRESGSFDRIASEYDAVGAPTGRDAPASSVRRKDRASSVVRSSARVIDILEFFQDHGRPARTVEVSAALGIPNSSADEILKTLVSRGYLQFNRRTKFYAPSYRIVETSRRIEGSFFGGSWLSDLMEDLRQSTGGTASLVIQDDCWIRCVAVRGSWFTDDYNREIISYDTGIWRPGTNSAAALLSTKPNLEIMDIVRRTKELGIAPKTPQSLEKLIHIVQRVRSRGFAVCRRNDTVQVDSIAAPVAFPDRAEPLAIGLMGPGLFKSDRAALDLGTRLRAAIDRRLEQFKTAQAW